VSTIKVDDWLKEELTRLQSESQMNEKTLSYNEIVKNAVKLQELAPIMMRYIYARMDSWNPYDLLSWFYEEYGIPVGEELVEVYARLIVETSSPLREKSDE
jgi:hypothetical protein